MAANDILIIDDDAELCALLRDYLAQEGFSVEAVHEGESGLVRALSQEHALVILDVMLPGRSGFDVLRRLRETSRIPVLMLTARGDDVDRIVGLEMGADDYLPKPFNPRELVARIRAVQRRSGAPSPGTGSAGLETLRAGDLELRPLARTVRCAGEDVTLTGAEFALLAVLLETPGRVVSRETLSDRVLGRPWSPLDRSIDVHVSNLRRKLGTRDDGGDRIRTVRGSGYVCPDG
jgi:two-component system response regulator CpxR